MANSRSSAAPVVVVAIVLLIVVLPVLYVLSIGPAIWLVNHASIIHLRAGCYSAVTVSSLYRLEREGYD